MKTSKAVFSCAQIPNVISHNLNSVLVYLHGQKINQFCLTINTDPAFTEPEEGTLHYSISLLATLVLTPPQDSSNAAGCQFSFILYLIPKL